MQNLKFLVQFEQAPRPRSYLEQLRNALRVLGPSPACLRFTGCARLLYKAAAQIDTTITVRLQQDGSYRVWKLPPPGTQNTCITPNAPGAAKPSTAWD